MGSTSTTASTDSVSTPGKMAVSTKATGTTASNTETASTDKLPELSAVDTGKRASACIGSTSRHPHPSQLLPNELFKFDLSWYHENHWMYEQKLLTMTKNLENGND